MLSINCLAQLKFVAVLCLGGNNGEHTHIFCTIVFVAESEPAPHTPLAKSCNSCKKARAEFHNRPWKNICKHLGLFGLYSISQMRLHLISGWPDIRADDSAFFDIRYRVICRIPDLTCRILKKVRYPTKIYYCV
jgi:hypothetical protein